MTAHQTAGRGRRCRTWVSPPGNLAATVLEAMPIQSAAAATLGFAAGLSLHRALDDLGIAAQLKWPNDVLLDGAKLSGIGLEAEAVGEGRLAVAVGIGVNVVSHPEGVPYAATSLAATGHEVTAEALFAALSERWAEYRAIWDLGRGMDKLRQAWLSRAAGIGGPVSVVLNGRTVAGTFETIDNEGHLIVLTADGRRVPIAGRRVLRRRGVVSPSRSGVMAAPDELSFTPLGGVGEIGINISASTYWQSPAAQPAGRRPRRVLRRRGASSRHRPDHARCELARAAPQGSRRHRADACS